MGGCVAALAMLALPSRSALAADATPAAVELFESQAVVHALAGGGANVLGGQRSGRTRRRPPSAVDALGTRARWKVDPLPSTLQARQTPRQGARAVTASTGRWAVTGWVEVMRSSRARWPG